MLSVVIPTYRKPHLLRRTLDALEPQVGALDAPCEVVVVDDGSGDATRDVLEAFRARLPLVEAGPPRNEGRAKARNRGWRAARGTWVLFLDDDIVLDDGALAAHVAAQRARGAAHLGDVVTAPEVVDSPLFDYLDSRGVAKLPPGGAAPARYFLTQNVSLPREALERVGGFDERFTAYGFEDMELAFRLEDRAGLTFHHLAGARGQHIHHHSLADYLQKKEICGRETLPLLLALHPHRAREMRLDILPALPEGLERGAGPLPALLAGTFRLRLPRLALALVDGGGSGLPSGLRRRIYDYLVLASYDAGLRQHRPGVMS